MCLNEIHFIELYLKSNLRFANEIVIIDGGSTDGTINILDEYRKKNPGKIKYEIIPQKSDPYSASWDTGTRRQWCLDHCTSDFVFYMDIDEMPTDKLINELPLLMNKDKGNGIMVSFNFVWFWKDFNTIRVNSHGDPASWKGLSDKFWTHSKLVTFPIENPHSSQITPSSFTKVQRKDLDLLHLHYASGRNFKINDNRRGDVFDFTQDYDPMMPDWEGKHLKDYKINIEKFTGKLPQLLREYFDI